MSAEQDPFASVGSVDPYANIPPSQRAAYAFQRAAIDAMRSRAAQNEGPTILLPFGRQEPLRRYAGMSVIPFRKNPWVDRPEMILKAPEPGWHYGFASYDARTRGMFRSHQYEPVYENELLDDNDVPYAIEQVLTEKGPMNLVIWHGLVMFKIPPPVWLREFELPALQSAARLTAHKDAFNEGKLHGSAVVRQMDDGVPTFTHQASETRVSPVHARTEMTITDVSA